jgi:hypothetical protein
LRCSSKISCNGIHWRRQRYDDLTGILVENMSGVGISFGLTAFIWLSKNWICFRKLTATSKAFINYGDTEAFMRWKQ